MRPWPATGAVTSFFSRSSRCSHTAATLTRTSQEADTPLCRALRDVPLLGEVLLVPAEAFGISEPLLAFLVTHRRPAATSFRATQLVDHVEPFDVVSEFPAPRLRPPRNYQLDIMYIIGVMSRGRGH